MVLMIFALVSMTVAQAAASTTLDFQAEDAKGFAEDRIHWRSNARNDRAVWLHNIGEYLTITICLLEPMHVTVEEVRFSSDGLEKRGAILVDKNEIDTFSTAGKSDFGKNWNVFQTAGPFNKTALAKGKHTFEVLMKSSMDPWGLEFDQIVVRFEGEVRREDIVCSEEQTSSSPITAPSDSSVLSTTASSHGPQSSTTISSSSTTFLDCTGGRCGSTSVSSTPETTSSPMSVDQTSSSSSTSIFMSTSQSTLSSTTFLTSSFKPSSEGDRQTISSPRTNESDGLQSTTRITFGGLSEGTSGFDSSTDRTSSTPERTGETTQVSSITKTLVTAETSSDTGKTPNQAETVTTSFHSSTASVDVVSPSALGGETSTIDGKAAGRMEHTLTDLITRDQGLTTHQDQITLGSDTSTYERATSSAHETTTFVIPTTTEGELTMSPSERKVSQVSEVTLSERIAASDGTTKVQTPGSDTILWYGETTTEVYQKTATEDNVISTSERNPEETATPPVSGEELAYNVNETWSHGKTEGVESTTQNVWLTSVGDETTSRETNTPGLTSSREKLTDGPTTQSVWKTSDVFFSSGKTSDITDQDLIYKRTTNLDGFTLSSELKTAVVPDTSYRAVHMLSTDETTVSVKTTPTVHEVNTLEGLTPGLGVGETTAFRETPSVYDTTQSIVKITGAEGVTTRSRDVYYTTPLDWIIASVSEVTPPPGEESGSRSLTVSSVSEVTPPPGEESGSGALTVSSVSEVTQPPGEESSSGALTVSSVSEVTPPSGEESGAGALTVSSVSEVTPPPGEESSSGALTVSSVSEVTPPPGEESGSGALTVSSVSEVTPPPGEESGSGALTVSSVSEVTPPPGEESSSGALTVSSVSEVTPPPGEESGSGALTVSSVSEVIPPPGEESGSGALTVSSVSEVTPPSGEESGSGALTVSSVSEVTPPSGEESGAGALTVSSVSEVTPPPGEESSSGALTVSSVSEVTPPPGEESGSGALTVSSVSEWTPPPGEESGSGALNTSSVSEVTPPPGEESGSGALNISNVDDLITPQEETTSPYLKQVTSEQKILATASTSSGEMSSGETQTFLSWKETSFPGKTTQSVDQYASSETTLVPRSSHGLEQTTLSAETKFDTSTSTSDKVTSVAYGTSPSTSSEHFGGFSQNSTLEQTTSASTTSRTMTASENFSFLCLRPEATTIIKRTSFSCYEGRYIFNVHVSQVTDLYLSVHNPAAAPRSKRQAALHRSTLASAGKFKHSTARDDCWSMAVSLNALPAEMRTVSTLRQLDVVLPARISAFSARSLKLRFNLKGFEARLKSRNAVSFVLTMRTSCSFGSSTVDMQVRDLDTDDVVVRKMGTILYDDPTLSSSLALVIPASVLTMEIQLNFSAASHSFILDALVFEVEYDESAVGQDKVPIADSAAAYNGWLGKKDKRYFLTRTKDVQLEGINRPGTKAMTVKARRKAGNGIEIRASRLIFSGVNVGSYVPRVIFDQTSRIFFFPQRDPSSQASFILGPRDPYAVDDVDSDLDEVEVDDQGDGNFTMNLTSIKYGRRSLVIGITSTTTTVLMSKMEDRFRDRLTSYIVCSFLLPCSEYGLSSQTFIRVDDAKEINAAGPWQDVTGKSVKVSRVFPV